MFFLDGGSGCGNVLSAQTTNFIGSLVKVIKTLVPIILIIMGSLEFAKATVAQNDDGLKKAKTNFIQKLIAGVAVFFVITFVSWLLGFLGESFGNKALECVSQFLGGSYTPGDIGGGGSSGGNSEEDYISCTKQCKELNNATAQYECQKSCDAKYDKININTTTTNENKDNCFKECAAAGQSEEYCQKHCDDTPAGTWDSCMTPCLEAGQSEAYCTKHCDSYFNGGSNFNPTATTTKKNNSTTTNNNNDEWNNCLTPCVNAGQSEAYCTKHCETQLNGGSN